MRKKRTSRNKKLIVLALLLAFAGILGVAVFKKFNQDKQAGNQTSETDPINYGPATEEEKQAGETQNEDVERKKNKPPVSEETGKKSVTPVITSAESDRVTAYVPGIVEEGGICTATFVNKSTGKTVIRTSEGFVNVSYTSCRPITPSLSPGSWTVTIIYKSATSEGTSQPEVIEVS